MIYEFIGIKWRSDIFIKLQRLSVLYNFTSCNLLVRKTRSNIQSDIVLLNMTRCSGFDIDQVCYFSHKQLERHHYSVSRLKSTFFNAGIQWDVFCIIRPVCVRVCGTLKDEAFHSQFPVRCRICQHAAFFVDIRAFNIASTMGSQLSGLGRHNKIKWLERRSLGFGKGQDGVIVVVIAAQGLANKPNNFIPTISMESCFVFKTGV